jgi:FAD:protein FMN transferase
LMQPFHLSFLAKGTYWNIDITKIPDSVNIEKLIRQIKDRIQLFDNTYSRFLSGSLVTKMSKKTGIYTLPPDGKKLLDLYHDMYQITQGSVTPLIGTLMEAAGYDARYSLKTKKVYSPPRWDDALEYSFPKLVVKKPVLLDFGAAGKGYLVDIIGKLLEDSEITNYCIDAGGDILYKSDQNSTLRVGLENPNNTNQVIGILELKKGSICSSAGNRRKWGKYHHIINPHTLTSPSPVQSTWVIAETAIIADALATALFFVPSIDLKLYHFEYLILYDDMSVEKSAGFNTELFTS